MSTNYFSYTKADIYKKRWKQLKSKIKQLNKTNKPVASSIKQEFNKLQFQKKAKLAHPFGVVISKDTFVKALFGDNTKAFKGNKTSKSWDFVIAHPAYDQEENEIYPIFTFCKGNRFKSYHEVPSPIEGGGGEGYKNGMTPPPM